MGIGNGDLLNFSIFFRGLDPFNDPADLVVERPAERNRLFPLLGRRRDACHTFHVDRNKDFHDNPP